jgi:hypothetical protein
MPAPISPTGRAALRQIREGELGERGVGGAAWTVTRRSGDGVGAATTVTTVGTAAALIGERPAGQLASAAPGSLVGKTEWEAIVIASGPALLPEDTLTSVASPTISFRLRNVTDRRLHETWSVIPL